MKLSVSLSSDDVALLDQYARTAGLPSRSAALHHAIAMLRHAGLEQDYAAAWDDWEAAGDDTARDVTVGDGTVDASR
jgi:hypothetical protein